VFGIVGVFPRSGGMPPWLLYLRREVCHYMARHGISDSLLDVVGKIFADCPVPLTGDCGEGGG